MDSKSQRPAAVKKFQKTKNGHKTKSATQNLGGSKYKKVKTAPAAAIGEGRLGAKAELEELEELTLVDGFGGVDPICPKKNK